MNNFFLSSITNQIQYTANVILYMQLFHQPSRGRTHKKTHSPASFWTFCPAWHTNIIIISANYSFPCVLPTEKHPFRFSNWTNTKLQKQLYPSIWLSNEQKFDRRLVNYFHFCVYSRLVVRFSIDKKNHPFCDANGHTFLKSHVQGFRASLTPSETVWTQIIERSL